MSRVPSANNAAAAAAKPKRSLPPRGRPWGLTWELPLRGRGQARRSLGHHRPHNFDSSTRRRRRRRGRLSDRRAAALLRRGPARNCPSPRGRRASAAGSRSAAAASRRRGRLRPSGPRAPAPHRPRPPRGSEAPAARQAHGSSRELGAPPAETQKARGSYCFPRGAEAARLSSAAREITSSRRPERGLPPAAAASSQLCRRRRRKRRRRNRLTSPPDHARAARSRSFGPERPLSERRPRAGRQRRHALGGGATAARRAHRCGRFRDPRASRSGRRAHLSPL